MPSVVIPAYNESFGIERCLRSVLADGVEGLVVVVVANACRDDTATRARSFGERVIVVETPDGGKTNALNLGERELRSRGLDRFPRLFLDGDIELEPGTLKALLAEASGPVPRIVSAEPSFDASGSTLPVRLFYSCERHNPYHSTTAPNGSGTYCVSREGRGRWSEFPAVIADDGFVGGLFADSERTTLLGRRSVVRVPKTMKALRGITARKRLGTAELQAVLPPHARQSSPSRVVATVLRACLPDPRRWPGLAVWISIKLLERLESRRVARLRGNTRWQHDGSSRS